QPSPAKAPTSTSPTWMAPPPKKNLGILGCDHQKKHFMIALLQDVEIGEVEHLRQAYLYINVRDGGSPRRPNQQRIGKVLHRTCRCNVGWNTRPLPVGV